jgi:hypothetical protein
MRQQSKIESHIGLATSCIVGFGLGFVLKVAEVGYVGHNAELVDSGIDHVFRTQNRGNVHVLLGQVDA